jgi:hypothetical protein
MIGDVFSGAVMAIVPNRMAHSRFQKVELVSAKT